MPGKINTVRTHFAFVLWMRLQRTVGSCGDVLSTLDASLLASDTFPAPKAHQQLSIKKMADTQGTFTGIVPISHLARSR